MEESVNTTAELLASSINSIASGGLLGTIGAIASYWLKRGDRAREREHELKMAELATDQTRWQSAQDLQAQIAANRTSAYHAAMNWRPGVDGADKWVVNVRSLFRPCLTMTLLVMSWSTIILLVWAARQGNAVAMAFNADNDLGTLIRWSVQSMLFMTSASVMFWYTGRELKLPHEK